MICDFNIPYKLDYETLPPDQRPSYEEMKMYEQIGGSRAGVSFGRRVELAATHLCLIPERILNTITQLVKLIFTAIACALSFGQSTTLNNEFRLAFGRTVINLAGIGINTIGLFAPVNAVKWNLHLIEKVVDALKGDVLDDQDSPDVLIPLLMSI